MNHPDINKTPISIPQYHLTEIEDDLIFNLLFDTNLGILLSLAETYGIRRVPGLSKRDAIFRILRGLHPSDLVELKNEVIAARYGLLGVEELLTLLAETDSGGEQRVAPRMDQITHEEARLVSRETAYWVYTMRGYDVLVDRANRSLSCGCTYFSFSARRGGLCKHLVTVFQLMPEVYAREILLDLLLTRRYGGANTKGWQFIALQPEPGGGELDVAA